MHKPQKTTGKGQLWLSFLKPPPFDHMHAVKSEVGLMLANVFVCNMSVLLDCGDCLVRSAVAWS